MFFISLIYKPTQYLIYSLLIIKFIFIYLTLDAIFFITQSLQLMHFANSAFSFSTLGPIIKKDLQPLQLAIKLAIYYIAAHKIQLKDYGTKDLNTLAPRTYKNSKEYQKEQTLLTHQTFTTAPAKPIYMAECTTLYIGIPLLSIIPSLTKLYSPISRDL